MKPVLIVLLFFITGCSMYIPHNEKIRYRTYRDHYRTKINHYYVYKDDNIIQLRKKIGENEFKVIKQVAIAE